MIATQKLRTTMVELGYRGTDVFEDYKFAAVDQPGLPVQESALAAFFESPPSYRNAAIGIVRVPHGAQTETVIETQRSLGAPFLIALGELSVSAWTFTSRGPSKLDEAPAAQWTEFSAKHASVWRADSVRRVKAIQIRKQVPIQETLFDPAILYSIQVQVQTALDTLLRTFLGHFQSGAMKSALSFQRDYRVLFPLAFRLLAAKILYDREDVRIASADRGNIEAVIDTVSQLYSLSPLPVRWNPSVRAQLAESWADLVKGVYVRNIAADDLAFVYENTLITRETRKAYGTHSTPPSVAEYVVRSFALPEGPGIQSLNVYEPFSGSCVFLTAAMRRFKELLPVDWSPSKMHRHLVSHFSASEVDQFACEIATLSLILADYPNANGWHIDNEDLFEGSMLSARLKKADMVICNPPFEDFDEPNGHQSIHKPVAALQAMLNRRPPYLGIVMPPGFNSHKKYGEAAEQVVSKYRDVELLELPEGSFRHASVGALVLIAQDPRLPGQDSITAVRKSVVHRSERAAFEQTLQPSATETVSVDSTRAPGFIGLKPLRDLWSYLAEYRRLGDVARVHRGLEWKGDQSLASSARAQKGSRKGVHRIAESLSQFRILKVGYLDCRAEAIRGGAIDLPWGEPKIICSAARMSRGPWRLAACADGNGLVASQQFFGIWLREDRVVDVSLSGLSAVLNSPLANAFSFTHDPAKRLRVDVMHQLPIPQADVARDVSGLIDEYVASVAPDGPLFAAQSRSMEEILLQIDALVLAAYDVPPRLEKALLKFMNEGERPCGHSFGPYPGTNQLGAIPLILRAFTKRTPDAAHAAWQKVLAPLPTDVANVFDEI